MRIYIYLHVILLARCIPISLICSMLTSYWHQRENLYVKSQTTRPDFAQTRLQNASANLTHNACVQLRVTRGDSAGSLINYIDSPMHRCTGVHTTSVRQLVCSGLWWYLLNVPEHVCVHVTDSRTRAKSKFSHSVTSFRSKLLHTSQRLSTSRIFFLLSFSLSFAISHRQSLNALTRVATVY